MCVRAWRACVERSVEEVVGGWELVCVGWRLVGERERSVEGQQVAGRHVHKALQLPWLREPFCCKEQDDTRRTGNPKVAPLSTNQRNPALQ